MKICVLKKEIQLCPLWNFISSDDQHCLASGTHCDIDVAEAWGSCPTYKKLFDIFEDVLRSRVENEDEKHGEEKSS